MNNCHLSVKYRLIYRWSSRCKSYKNDSNINFQECSPRTTPVSFAAGIWIITQRMGRSIAWRPKWRLQRRLTWQGHPLKCRCPLSVSVYFNVNNSCSFYLECHRLGIFFYLYKQVVQEFLWYNFVHCVPWQRGRQGGRLWNTWPHGPISISASYSRVNLDLVSSLTLSWHCSFIAFKLLFIRSAFLESKNIGYWRSLVKYYKLVNSQLRLLHF